MVDIDNFDDSRHAREMRQWKWIYDHHMTGARLAADRLMKLAIDAREGDAKDQMEIPLRPVRESTPDNRKLFRGLGRYSG